MSVSVLLTPSCGQDAIPFDATPGEATLVTTYQPERPMPLYSTAFGVQGDPFGVATTDIFIAPTAIELLRLRADGSPGVKLTGTRFAARADTTLFSGT